METLNQTDPTAYTLQYPFYLMTAAQSIPEASYQIHVTQRKMAGFVFFEHFWFIFLCKSLRNVASNAD
jgi:hypothetical protein